MNVDRPLRIARASAALAWTAADFTLLEAKLLARPAAPAVTAERELQRWCRGLLWIAGVDLRLASALPPPPRKARLVVANHRTAYDFLILFALFGGSFVSRAEVVGWPLIGHAARRSQTIFTDRASARSGAQAIRAIRSQLKRGRTVLIFPEGTTSAGDDLLPFSAGAMAAARGLDVEIVPVGFAYPPGSEYIEDSFLDHVGNLSGRHRLAVGLSVGASQQPTGGRAQLVRALEAAVAAQIKRARSLL